jgi:hypothetical protein
MSKVICKGNPGGNRTNVRILGGFSRVCTRSVKSGHPCNPHPVSGIKVGKTQIGLDPDETRTKEEKRYVSTNHAPGPCHPVG